MNQKSKLTFQARFGNTCFPVTLQGTSYSAAYRNLKIVAANWAELETACRRIDAAYTNVDVYTLLSRKLSYKSIK